MKRRITAVFMAIIMVMGLIGTQSYSVEADAVRAGSTIDTSDTIEISNLAELEAFRDSVNGGNTYEEMTVKLTADIDMSEKYGQDINGKAVSWIPVGNTENEFEGVFDGGGHEITNLYINTSADYQGLFGFIRFSTIQNLIVDGTITGGDYVGGIVGCDDRGVLINCHHKGKVAGNSNVGGIVGDAHVVSTVKNCSNTGDVNGTGNQIGGIIGYNEYSKLISMCYNWGDVHGGTYEGGAKGGKYVGGIIGMQETTENSYTNIEKCYNTGDINGINHVGGIIGNSWYGKIENCYNAGSVIGLDNTAVGGILGVNAYVKVENCYNAGYVIRKFSGGYIVGLNVFSDSEVPADCYYLQYEEYGDIEESEGIKAVSAEDFAKQSVFAGWDFSNVWIMNGALGRPVLQMPKEEKRIVSISTLEELEAFRDNVNSGNTYKGVTVMLTADIDMSGKYGADIGGKKVSWTPIGISYEKSFRGIFDGGEHKIKGLYINTSEDYQGLFGFTYGAEIKNISVSGNVFGGWMVGGIAGYNQEGLMENCHNLAAVTGGWNCDSAYYIGGVTGRNDGILKNCSNEGVVACNKGTIGTGGIAGVNNADIENCSNTGKVTGRQAAGGICGENEGGITNCHNTGEISGFYYVGGIVGDHLGSTVGNCFNKGRVLGTEDSRCVGGIAGSNQSVVRGCYNLENVSGYADVGGIVGENWNELVYCYNKGTINGNGSIVGGVTGNNIGSVILCYNTGNVTGKFLHVGGISGLNDSNNDSNGFIAGCYSTGNISGSDGVGGVVGNNWKNGEIEDCYYLTGTAAGGVCGQDTVNALKKTMTDFARKSTFYNWDFNAEWEMSSDLGRPVLRSNKETGGASGTFKLGDVNGDKVISSKDALEILKYSVGLETPGMIKEVADVNKDTYIDSKDALMILQHSVGLLQIQ